MSSLVKSGGPAVFAPSSRPGLAGCAILALVIVLTPAFVSSDYVLRVVALVWIMSLAAVGLHVTMGLAGQISLGQAGFFAIGAYASAVLPVRFGIPPILTPFVGCTISALVAYLVGRPILRLKGHYLAIATLGFSLLVSLAATNEVQFTGGPDGVAVPRITFGSTVLDRPETWYWISGGLLWCGTALVVLLRQSPSGRAMRAILDSEVAAASAGVDVAARKLEAFVTAAVFGSVAGSTLALMNGFITPEAAGFLTSVELVAMVVIGGSASAFGAIVGAALLTILPQVLASFHDYQDLGLGLLIMLSMIYLPDGIAPTLSRLAERVIRRWR